jgi:hypothetical protein
MAPLRPPPPPPPPPPGRRQRPQQRDFPFQPGAGGTNGIHKHRAHPIRRPYALLDLNSEFKRHLARSPESAAHAFRDATHTHPNSTNPTNSSVPVQKPPSTSTQQLTCPLQTPHPRTLKNSMPNGSLKAGRAVERAIAFIRLLVAISSTTGEQKIHPVAQDSQGPFVSQTLAEIVTETVFLATSATNAENRTPGQTKMVPHITPGLRLSGPSRRQALRNNPRWLPGLCQILRKSLQ